MAAKYAAEDDEGNPIIDEIQFTVRMFYDNQGVERLSKVVKIGDWDIPNWEYEWQSATENQDWLILVAQANEIISWDDPSKEWQMHRICRLFEKIYG